MFDSDAQIISENYFQKNSAKCKFQSNSVLYCNNIEKAALIHHCKQQNAKTL